MMATMNESERVQELEYELGEVRAAFDDYVKSSQALENGLDEELGKMRTFSSG